MYFFTVNFCQAQKSQELRLTQFHLGTTFAAGFLFFLIIYAEWNQSESGRFSLQLQFISLNFTTQHQTAGRLTAFYSVCNLACLLEHQRLNLLPSLLQCVWEWEGNPSQKQVMQIYGFKDGFTIQVVVGFFGVFFLHSALMGTAAGLAEIKNFMTFL